MRLLGHLLLDRDHESSGSFVVAAGAAHRLPVGVGGNQLDVTFRFSANASGTFGVRVLAPTGAAQRE